MLQHSYWNGKLSVCCLTSAITVFTRKLAIIITNNSQSDVDFFFMTMCFGLELFSSSLHPQFLSQQVFNVMPSAFIVLLKFRPLQDRKKSATNVSFNFVVGCPHQILESVFLIQLTELGWIGQ